MDKVYLKELLSALKSELIRFRFWVVGVFICVSFAVLLTGMSWPKKYSTSITLIADTTKIVGSLLEGKAEMTKIDRSEQAQQFIYSRGVMEAAAKDRGLIKKDMSPEDQDRVIRGVRANLEVKADKNNIFKLSFSSGDPDNSFEMLNAIVNIFLADTEKRKREESLGAYNFIDAQVQSLKHQLELAEEKLKEFNSENLDGSRETVTGRLAGLRSEIENLKITIEESQARVNTLQQQLGNEGQYQQGKGVSDDLRQRRAALSTQLEKLLMDYQEDYPDVVSTRAQLTTLNASIKKMEESGQVYSNSENIANPLYEELRKQLSVADVELRSQKRRMESLVRLQSQEEERAQRVAAGQAQYSDLTRDYNVTRKVYEDMLEKKNAARVSMTLDIEGQGVSYRIQDPAVFPLKPTGIGFFQFAILGPILGLLLPIVLLIAFVVVDPHIRMSRVLQAQLPPEIGILGVIPHYNTPLGERLLKKDMIAILALTTGSLILYVLLASYWLVARV
ncbi:MAG TPA: chain length-determining protein [Cellvibrio sp.]|nr:chain length-determining protein [Cellvibrio sp.]